MPLSLAEHATTSIGIDPIDRFGHAGVTLAVERRRRKPAVPASGRNGLPFKAGTFDLVLSHAVIEHVPDADRYLRECRRVMTPGGRFYLSTAPYLSFAGAHLPRLRVPVPLHLIAGRPVAFRTFRWLARHAAWTLREPAHENSFIRDARRGVEKEDDLLEKVRVRRLRDQIAAAGLRTIREELHVTATVRRLPAPLERWVRDSPLIQDALISNMEYVLAPGGNARPAWLRSTATVRTIAVRSRRYIAASSATIRPTRTGCAGNGSIAETRTASRAVRSSGSRARARPSSDSTRRCRCGCRSRAAKSTAPGAWT